MSAAGRGGPRIDADNYPTPRWATFRILEALWGDWSSIANRSAQILEPCCGEGAIVRAVQAFSLGAVITSCDIRNVEPVPGVVAHYEGVDATKPLGLIGAPSFDLLITNPPFNVAHEIIQAQRDTAKVCAYLLRSTFIAGERAEAYRNDMPTEFRLPERPKFIASDRCVDGERGGVEFMKCGWSQKVPVAEPKPRACPSCGGIVARSTTDATPYSWFVWTSERRSEGRCVILPATPVAERKARL
jgi:hypothetical protein